MKENSPTISIVIIGFNTEQSLKKLLASIEKIIYTSEDVEVIYVDDGSTDNSLSVFEKYKLKFKTKSFVFKKNMGRVCATDKGIKLATGEWIFLLQSNVIVNPNIINAPNVINPLVKGSFLELTVIKTSYAFLSISTSIFI